MDERQIFDTAGEFVFRIHPGDRLWPLVREAFARYDTESGDVAVDLNGITEALAVLEPELGDRLAGVRAKGRTGEELDEASVDVLGQQVWVNPRDPEDGELQRLNRLVSRLREAREAGLAVQVLQVPALGPLPHRVATLLRSAPDGIAGPDLPRRVLAWIDELGRTPPFSTNFQQALRLDAESVRGDGLDDALSTLASARLIDEAADGSIRATPKLRTIII
jgi:hypothetical protein